MGAYLPTPCRDKVSEDKDAANLRYGASSMQGWRVSQEDAHNCCVDFDKDTSLFAVYDGHGGHEVAQYTALKFPDFIKNLKSYKDHDLAKALEEAFLEFDATLTQEHVVKELTDIAGVAEDGDDEDNDEEKEVADLCEEADMPIEKLMERYGGHVPSASVKVLRKKEDFKSPVIKPKKDTPSLTASKEGESNSCDQGNGSSEVTDSVKVKLDDQLVNGHSNSACVNSSEIKAESSKVDSSKADTTDTSKADSSKADSSSDNDGVDSTSEDKPASKHSKHTASKEPKLGASNEAEAIHAGSDSSDVGSSTNGKHSSGGSKEAEVSGGCSSTAEGSSTSHCPPGDTATRAGEREAVAAGGSCSSSGEAAGSSCQQAEEPSSSTGRTRSKRRGVIPEEGEDESSFDEEEETTEEEEDSEEDGEDQWQSASSDDLKEKLERARHLWRDVFCSEDDGEEGGEGEGEDMEVLSGGEEPGADSGCTAVVALLREDQLLVANAGDSRCVLCRGGKAVDMSIDHKPEDQPEMDRITHAGGRVTMDGRVNGGLNLSRAIGDHVYKMNADLPLKDQMITALPDVKTVTLQADDEFMVLACDGIWNVMTSQDVVDFVRDRLKGEQTLSSICEEMFEYCLAPDTTGDGSGCDNMTCVIVTLDKLVSKFPASAAKRPASAEPENNEARPEPKRQKL